MGHKKSVTNKNWYYWYQWLPCICINCEVNIKPGRWWQNSHWSGQHLGETGAGRWALGRCLVSPSADGESLSFELVWIPHPQQQILPSHTSEAQEDPLETVSGQTASPFLQGYCQGDPDGASHSSQLTSSECPPMGSKTCWKLDPSPPFCKLLVLPPPKHSSLQRAIGLLLELASLWRSRIDHSVMKSLRKMQIICTS